MRPKARSASAWSCAPTWCIRAPPDALRGRVNAVNALFISSSNQWGAVESGLAAKWMGTVPSVVFGGAATIFVVGLIASLSANLRRWKN
jgi:hypothetical protein